MSMSFSATVLTADERPLMSEWATAVTMSFVVSRMCVRGEVSGAERWGGIGGVGGRIGWLWAAAAIGNPPDVGWMAVRPMPVLTDPRVVGRDGPLNCGSRL